MRVRRGLGVISSIASYIVEEKVKFKLAIFLHFCGTYLILVYVFVSTTLIYLSLSYTITESFYYVNYGSSIIASNNLSNENINNGVSAVFKTKRELKCQNELFLKYHFSGNTSVYVFITEII